MSKSKAKKLKPSEIVTPPCRLSFPALFEPRPVSSDKPDDLKYQASIIIPKGTDLTPFKKAMKAAAVDRWGKVPGIKPRNIGLKSAAEKPDVEGYNKGDYFISAKSKHRPQVVDRALRDLHQDTPEMRKLREELCYAGAWFIFHINAFAYDHPEGGKGISFGLNSVQFFKHGDRFDMRRAPEEVFEALEALEDDEAPDVEGDDGMDDLFGSFGDADDDEEEDDEDDIPF